MHGNAPGAEVYLIHNGERLGDSYAQYFDGTFKPLVYTGLINLGLSEDIQAVANKHIADLNIKYVQTAPSGEMTYALEGSTLDLQEEPDPNGPKKFKWQRYALLSIPEVSRRIRLLSETIYGDAGTEDDQLICRDIATEWVFSELCFMAAGNATDMQRRYYKYVKNFNGQSDYYNGHLAITDPNNAGDKRSAKRFSAMQKAFGFMMLCDSLVSNVSDVDMDLAREIVTVLQTKPGLEQPMPLSELKAYLSTVEPSIVPSHRRNRRLGSSAVTTLFPNLKSA